MSDRMSLRHFVRNSLVAYHRERRKQEMLEIPPNPSEYLTMQHNWRHVGAFLGLTFSLTWLLDLLIYWHGGLGTPGALGMVQLQMLFPAFSAIVLGIFFFPESPLYYRRPAGRGRWFYFSFLLLTLISAFGDVGAWLGRTRVNRRTRRWREKAVVPQPRQSTRSPVC